MEGYPSFWEIGDSRYLHGFRRGRVLPSPRGRPSTGLGEVERGGTPEGAPRVHKSSEVGGPVLRVHTQGGDRRVEEGVSARDVRKLVEKGRSVGWHQRGTNLDYCL